MMLDDVKVVEIGQAFAGPYASQILAHLGAEVIKVERPGVGDEARRFGPPSGARTRRCSTRSTATRRPWRWTSRTTATSPPARR